MCDTLCAVGPAGTLFAKNSDRPCAEVQLIEAHPARRGGGRLRTQYLEIEDPGAAALVGARPAWLWGMEHGVNQHRVAIGNEKVFTTDDPYGAPDALIGMDLVRLGLERGRSAEEALDTVTSLLERHGQGGVADRTTGEPYFSSFLIADPTGGWVLETSGRTWVARPAGRVAAISNRLTIRGDWTHASGDVAPASDFDRWRNTAAPTGHADRRLGASCAFLDTVGAPGGPEAARGFAGHLRDHGTGPWGVPGAPSDGEVVAPPPFALPDGTGVTVCMHVRGYQDTTSSMVAWLPADRDAPLRAWVAPGSPCVSVFVPLFPAGAVPRSVADPEIWERFAALRDLVEGDAGALARIRALTAPVEADLWDEADSIAGDPARWGAFAAETDRRLVELLARLP